MHFSVQLVVQPASDNILEQLNRASPSSHPTTHTPSHPHMFDDLGLGMEGEGEEEGRGEAYEPSPFSTKKDMYSGKSGTQVQSTM